MTKLQIISKLWSIIFDLILIIKGESDKTLEQIEKDVDLAEYHCRRYTDTDDDELPENIRAEPLKDILPF
jgi:hypothetical protein